MDQVSLKTLFFFFLRLGCTAFGGPAAHIAQMRKELVEQKAWLSESDFLDLVGATNLIPGPNSTELAIHIGYEKCGWKGLIVAGFAFIFPAVCLTLGLACLYAEFGRLPNVKPWFYGIQAVIIPIVVMAILPMAKVCFKHSGLIAISILAFIASFFPVNQIMILFAAGCLFAITQQAKNNTMTMNRSALVYFSSGSALKLPVTSINTKLFFIFLKVGAILYGSGYVLFSFLDEELVKTGLTSKEVLVDAIAVGQFTPGPVFSSVTFIGFQMNGFSGATVATIAIFLPSFVFVGLIKQIMRLLKKLHWFRYFLDAVNAVSIALIMKVCWDMGVTIHTDWHAILIAVCGGICMLIYPKINTVYWLIGACFLGSFLFYCF